MSEKIRIVIDTNILLDIVYFDDPRIQNLKKALENKQLEAWSCDLIWAEFLDVLKRPLFYTNEANYQRIAEQAKIYFQIETALIAPSSFKCKDQDDQVFIDLAVSKAPCWLFTKDNEVLKLAKRLLLVNVFVSQAQTSNLFSKMPWQI